MSVTKKEYGKLTEDQLNRLVLAPRGEQIWALVCKGFCEVMALKVMQYRAYLAACPAARVMGILRSVRQRG